MLSRRAWITGLAAGVGLVAAVNIAAPRDNDVPATQLGTAAVELGNDTARIVESVSYRQVVERVGDVVIVNGEPRDELNGELAAMWAIVDASWPADQRDRLAQLSVVREESRGLVGVVHPSATGGWVLSLDIADIDDRPLIEETIVHELSHAITLDRDVFTFGEVDACSGVAISLGCAEADTILTRFAERFWPEDVASTLEDDFVNDYASTAAHEDLAETFTAWVLGWPIEDATVKAKIEMLTSDSELAALADTLRERLTPRR